MTIPPDVPDSGVPQPPDGQQPGVPQQPGVSQQPDVPQWPEPGAPAEPMSAPTPGQFSPGPYPQQGQFPHQGQFSQQGPVPPYGQFPPPGQFPQPGSMPPNYAAQVAPKKSNLTWLWIVLAILPILMVGSCVAFVATADRSSSTEPALVDDEDVAVGDCVRVARDTSSSTDPADIDIRSTACTSPLMTWVVAEKAPTEASCAEGLGSLWWEETTSSGETRQKSGSYALCVHANYKQGECYLEPEDPAASLASLADFEVTSCGIPPTKAGFVVYKVETASTAQPQCPEGQIAEYYEKPTPLGLCLTKVQFT